MFSIKSSVVVLAAVFLLSSRHVTAHEPSTTAFFAFGGSVKWKNSEVSIKQFSSQLKIHVYSLPDMILRQVVSVLPNGAYSVVVSDNGRYRIRLSAPQGWNFRPIDGYEINLKDFHGDQMKYTFELIGFDVNGQVVTIGMTTGPQDLIVSAISGGNIFSQTMTAINGSFTLSSLPPGTYIVTVGDSPTAGGVSDARVTTNITVSTTTLRLTEPLVLQGHSLRSKITFNGQGVANISIILLVPKSNELKKADFVKFGCSNFPQIPLDFVPVNLIDVLKADLVCQVFSDTEGVFAFSRLAGGDYFLVAYHDPLLMRSSVIKSNRITINPPFLSVKMAHVDLEIDPGFEVSSFRVSGGNVKLPSGIPIADAEILLNGLSVTKTNSNGAFELDVNASSEYIFHVKAPRFKFPNVKVLLTLTTENLPTFVPNGVEVCGHFLMANSLKHGTRLPPVEVVSAPSIEAEISNGGKSAKFCLYLSPENHTLRLGQSPKFVKFTPPSIKVDLSFGPVDNITFTQFQAVLMGEVFCIETCPASELVIRLSAVDESSPPLIVAVEADKNNHKHATFIFNSTSPGRYDLELLVVGTDSVNPAGGWCWAPPGLLRRVTVIDRDLWNTPELIFQQTGYKLHFDAPLLEIGFDQPIDLLVTPSTMTNAALTSGKPFLYRLTKPLNIICLSHGSSFTFDVSAPCLRLEMPSPSSIKSAAIDIPPSTPPKIIHISVREIPVHVVVTALRGIEDISRERLPVLSIQAHFPTSTRNLSAVWTKEGDFYVSRMNLWAAPGDEIVISISFPESTSDKDAIQPLIIPSSQTLRVPSIVGRLSHLTYDGTELQAIVSSRTKVNEVDCDAALAAAFGGTDRLTATFSMKPGYFFTGTVQPPVDKVLVLVYSDASFVSSLPLKLTTDMSTFFSEDQLNTPSPKRDLAMVARTLTNAQGVFRIGPFYFEKKSLDQKPSSLLSLQLHKTGFVFTLKSAADWLNFSSQKLALVEIRVVSEPDLKSLPGTLVSIIGSVFRDSKTADSKGIIRYIGLPPGEYYIQPILKEYEFFVRKGTQNQLEALVDHPLSVLDGESLSVSLIGRRIAYSAFGEVTSLSGHPEAGVLVEAKLLSSRDMEALEGRSIFPAHGLDVNITCRGNTGDVDFIVPVEQSMTDEYGRFKLLGLLPGCPYLVSASLKKSGKVYRQAFPPSVIVKPLLADVHDLHFYLKPHISLGMISATVDTSDDYFPDLSIVIRSSTQPNKYLIRHNFAFQPRFFSLLGNQIDPLIGDSYVIVLEDNSARIAGQNTTIQKFYFTIDEKSSNEHLHFNFAYHPTSASRT